MSNVGDQQIDFFDSGYSYSNQDQSGQNFNYSEEQGGNFGDYSSYGGYDQSYNAAPGFGNQGPSIMTPQQQNFGFNSQIKPDSTDFSSFEDEPPLLEELGINFEHITQKTMSVLHPFQQTDPNIMDDTDLAGPFVFCIAFGALLLLSGKVHGFGYIYGVGVLGCLSMYAVLNFMSMTGVTLSCVVSILGYCLLPMVLLSGVSVVLTLQGSLGTILSTVVILWCSWSASKLFVTVLAMDSQQLLVAYPCALLYCVFALLTVF